MDITFGQIYVLSLLEAPFFILLWIVIRALKHSVYINTSRTKRRVLYSVMVLALIVSMIILAAYMLMPVVNRYISYHIPLGIKLALVVILLTFDGCTLGLVMGLAVGLRDVVRAGGSPSQIVGTLFGYIKDSINLDKIGKNTETIDSEKKDRPE